MTYRIISTSSVGTLARVFMPTAGDGTYIPAGIVVGAEDDITIFGQTSNQRVTVDGVVASGGPAGIHLGDNPIFDTHLAVIVGQTGIIRGVQTAIFLVGQDNQIVNHGQIGGGAIAIMLSGQGPGLARVVNHGVISADTAITRYAISDSETISVLNWGTIEGRNWAYDGTMTEVVDRLTNRGLIVGDVQLGGGDDWFDTRGAGEVAGRVFGGTGNDTFLLGAAEDDIDGGIGIDTIDATASGAITLALDGTVDGTGRAAGDTYVGIETILGSRLGADYLIGTTGAQTLSGQGGADRLEGRGGADSLLGGDGNDRLVGQTGADVLTGGAGDDRFIFRALVEAGDVILDFAGVGGNNDAFEISVSGFGAGLVRGIFPTTRLQVRSDNVAQDADDRFIFRTTDTTLWFDNNGNGSGGLTLVADLQTGATLTAGDFILV